MRLENEGLRLENESLKTVVKEKEDLIKILEQKLSKQRMLLMEKRNRIKSLKVGQERKAVRIKDLKNLLDELKDKHLLNDESVGSLRFRGKLSDIERHLFLKKERVGQYSPEVRAFALSLHFVSPKAYSYVRSNFTSCLPHPKTIAKWYMSVDGSPGFSQEALDALKNLVDNTSYPLHCALMFDEMAIRKYVEWNGERVIGFVDFGDEKRFVSDSLAKEALVFLVNIINLNMKIPVAYFLVDGINAEQKSSLVEQCLIMLHEHGVNIESVTCDGPASNISMFNYLGCEIGPINTVPDIKCHFDHPSTGKAVNAFLDPCHMIKLIRNTFGDKELMYDLDGNTVNWVLISRLHRLQTEIGLHCGNKLRSAHVNFKANKMKVKLATQLLSTSVAKALQWCHDQKIKGFENVKGTVKFLEIFDKLFDIFNSRAISQSYFKKPMCKGNVDDIKIFFNEATKYIMHLKHDNGDLVCNGPRRTGFIGFLLCMKSAVNMYERLVVGGSLRYIPFYKVSQDNLEVVFGYIRSHHGCNNNPTPRQFMTSMKKILIHQQLHAPKNGNCIPLETIKILTCSMKKKPEDAINDSMNTWRTFKNEEPVSIEHAYSKKEMKDLGEFGEEIVKYIAGYVSRSIQEKIVCEECCAALTDINTSASLIAAKNRGGLVYPSNDVVTICIQVERYIRRFLNTCGVSKINKSVILGIKSHVLKYCLDKSIFSQLFKHSLNFDFNDNHLYHLINLVVETYFKVRIHHTCKLKASKEVGISTRHKNNKLTLFKGH